MFKRLKEEQEKLKAQQEVLETIDKLINESGFKIGSVVIFNQKPGLISGLRVTEDNVIEFAVIQVTDETHYQENMQEEYKYSKVWATVEKIAKYTEAAAVLF